jgi:hypothetical protein
MKLSILIPITLRRLSPFKGLASFCLLAFMLPEANGQTASASQLPPGPLLASPPAFSQWVITFSYADEQTSKPTGTSGPPLPAYLKLRPRTVTTTKTKDLIHENIVVISGPMQDKWYVGNTQYWKIADEPDWYVNNPVAAGETPGESYTPLPKSGFRDLEWVSEKTYTGTENHAGKQCLVFKSNKTSGNHTLSFVAYVDLKTRLPVEAQISGETRAYQFLNGPTTMQTLPDDLAAQITRGEKARALLDTRAPTAL